MIDSNPHGFKAMGSSEELIVVLHAYMSSPKKLKSLCRVITENFPNADLYVPTFSAYCLSTTDPNEIVATVLEDIDMIWDSRTQKNDEGSAYKKIIFVGHSLGALLARQVYVRACGELVDLLDNEDSHVSVAKPWAKKIERIILLAGMNRGWRVTHHLSLLNAIIWSVGVSIGNVIEFVTGKSPLIFSIRKGAPFITKLRIGWILMRNKVKERQIGSALTIQLLGTVDDMVSPGDNIDLVSGHDFIYLDVPQSGHANVIDMDDRTKGYSIESNKDIATVGSLREGVFVDALKKSKEELEVESILPSDLPLEDQRENVTDVVFVIHGIRDKGYWTHKVARNILKTAKLNKLDNIILATETSTYGYFPMLPFLLSSKRREKVEWLMDQYAQSLSLYPNAEFSFVGHSNGTYLLAKSLEEYPFCKFKNVVFAGSVVTTKYDWEKLIKKGQVKKVLNYVATADWVVACFPKAIQMLKLQDLGSAGHDGFDKSPSVNQVTYVRGCHGAALNEANWESISKFILTGDVVPPPASIRNDSQSLLVKVMGVVAPFVWLIIFTSVASVFYLIWGASTDTWEKVVYTIMFSVFIWKMVTVF